MTLRNNLICLMKERKSKIKELADLTGISEPTLKRLRTKECNPTLDVLIKLSRALNISVDELIPKSVTLKCNSKKNNEAKNLLSKGCLSTVDTDTFTLVLKEIIMALSDQYSQLCCEDIIDFCYDIYNNVITTSINNTDKIAIIKLAIASLKRGNLLKTLQDKTG